MSFDFDPDDPYRTLASHGESELVVDRSRFLGEALPVESEEKAESYVEAVRDEHYDARHVCYGLRVGRGPQRIDRSNDDGEPPRTGGFPIWQVLDGENITHSLCLVVRYFGGVELGTGRLRRAYRETAREAIDEAGITTRHPERRLHLNVPYERLDEVEHLVDSSDCARTLDTEYTDDVALTLAIYSRDVEDFCERLGGTLQRSPESWLDDPSATDGEDG